MPISLFNVSATISRFLKRTTTNDDKLALRNDIAAAPLASPAFTGTPTAPTATVGTNTTQLATTAFVAAAAAAVESQIGPSVITRTAAQGPPTSAESVVVTGFLTSNGSIDVTFPPLADIGDLNGRAEYFSAPDCRLYYDGAKWILNYDADTAVWESPDDNLLPWDADWADSAISPATGIPTLELVTGISGEVVGQLVRVGDASPYQWYLWDGTNWILFIDPA